MYPRKSDKRRFSGRETSGTTYPQNLIPNNRSQPELTPRRRYSGNIDVAMSNKILSQSGHMGSPSNKAFAVDREIIALKNHCNILSEKLDQVLGMNERLVDILRATIPAITYKDLERENRIYTLFTTLTSKPLIKYDNYVGKNNNGPLVKVHICDGESPTSTQMMRNKTKLRHQQTESAPQNIGIKATDIPRVSDPKTLSSRRGGSIGSQKNVIQPTSPYTNIKAIPHRTVPVVTSTKGGRQVFDKRVLRRRDCASFVQSINVWLRSYRVPTSILPEREFRVLLRKRPLRVGEDKLGEFDCVSIHENVAIVHQCLYKPDLRNKYILHQGFAFNSCYHEANTCKDVFAEVYGLVVSAATGGMATMMLFGQTGSGKTYTMNGIFTDIAETVFNLARNTPVIGSCLEIMGKKIRDIGVENGSFLKLFENPQGGVEATGLQNISVKSPQDLIEFFDNAQKRRKSAPHSRNPESSRSHSVLRVTFENGGTLVLCDLAGTEARLDTENHSAVRIKETADINLALHTLRECMRTFRSSDDKPSAKPQYRGSMLTRVLADCFTTPKAQIVAIGTVAPNASDVEHTLRTIHTLQMLTSDSK